MIGGSISIPASSNDGISKAVNGFADGHAIDIQLYRNSQTYKLNKVVVGGTDLFEKNGSLFAKVSVIGLPEIQIVVEKDQLKCYPNPFNDQLNIEIKIFDPKNLEVSIYDLSGKFIRNLYNGKAAKVQQFVWDGTNGNGAKVVSGTYILKANEMIEKIVLKE